MPDDLLRWWVIVAPTFLNLLQCPISATGIDDMSFTTIVPCDDSISEHCAFQLQVLLMAIVNALIVQVPLVDLPICTGTYKSKVILRPCNGLYFLRMPLEHHARWTVERIKVVDVNHLVTRAGE
jgi:hypothetical protein